MEINGERRSVPRLPKRKLLEILRLEFGLFGAKYGCGEGECGACTVLLDGEAIRACQVEVDGLDGRKVVTVEGLAPRGALSPVQRAFAVLGAFQCGFCTPGMVVAATALLARNPYPSEAEIRGGLESNLCRCCGYARILQAVTRAVELARPAEGVTP